MKDANCKNNYKKGISIAVWAVILSLIFCVTLICLSWSYLSDQSKTTDEAYIFAHQNTTSVVSSSNKGEVINLAVTNFDNKVTSNSKVTSDSKVTVAKKKSKMPILVNPKNKIPKDYEPNLVKIDNGYYLDKQAATAYNKMKKAATKDGISLWVVSAYRSQERQVTVFNNKVKEYMNMGYSKNQAYDKASKFVAIPGTSEHSLGLALDINSLYQNFEKTKEFKWLYKNCAKYGFILRYPKDKTDITQINYEPWHYRYVGTTIAKEIMKDKICLEEYTYNHKKDK